MKVNETIWHPKVVWTQNCAVDKGYHYSPAVGWHWYNEPADQQETPEAQKLPQKPPSAVETMRKIKALGDDVTDHAKLIH